MGNCKLGCKMAEANDRMASGITELSECMNAFSLDLYKLIIKQNPKENAFLSPSSVMVVMAMVYMGAKGNTLDQMKKTLKFDKLENKEVHILMQEFIGSLRKGDANVTLKTANRLFPHVDNTITEEFVNTVSEYFMADTKKMDYNNFEEAILEINKWVEGETNNKIKNLLAEGTLNIQTRLVIVNAIYFKGEWATQFDPKDTTKEVFHSTGGKAVTVDMMIKQFKYTNFGFSKRLDSQILELPYKGEELSMLVILPNKKKGLASLEAKITFENLLKSTNCLNERTVDVKLPKFKLTSCFILNDHLIKLGMPDLFDAKADLSGMSKQPLFVSHVVHKAFVDVNEEGTEATAATATIEGLGSMRCMDIAERFQADHPFLFIIWDRRGKVPLFMGRLVAPEGSLE